MTASPMTRYTRLRMFSYRCPECGEPPLMTGGRVTVPHPETCVHGRRVRRMTRPRLQFSTAGMAHLL